MRLAFAVAAHMDPQILLVDEVLAVGDSVFQQKCLRKMRNVAGEGRTVLFVSHNFEAVKSLCTRCLLLHEGRIVFNGLPEPAIETAVTQFGEPGTGEFKLHAIRNTEGVPKPETVAVRAARKAADEVITFDDEIVATLRLNAPLGVNHTFAFQIMTMSGVTIFNSFYGDDPENPPLVTGRTHEVSIRIPSHLLPGGRYEVVFAYMLPNADHFWVARDVWFEVHDLASYRNEGLTTKRTGLVSMVLRWDAN
jgi:lipopolysaccharide transport system ATP-binding protein